MRTPSILVVDDDAAIRMVLSEALCDEGYEVVTAADGAEALRYLKAAAVLPGAILLDLMMPVMTGWEFRLAQQQDPGLASIPVVALSARRSLAHERYTITVDVFLPKPVDLGQLLDVVAQLCG